MPTDTPRVSQPASITHVANTTLINSSFFTSSFLIDHTRTSLEHHLKTAHAPFDGEQLLQCPPSQSRQSESSIGSKFFGGVGSLGEEFHIIQEGAEK